MTAGDGRRSADSGGWTTWRTATERALYGPGGFYRRTSEGPRDHFRTSAHASGLFAGALLTLARVAGLDTVVDIGTGRGELLVELRNRDPSLHLIGVELADRPAELPADIAWTDTMPTGVTALVVANEWLDNVPVDVVELTSDGPRVVEVDASGNERIGAPPGDEDARWLAQWWPLREVGDRAEVGRPRDLAWADVVGTLRHGVAVAIDYCHAREERPPGGSLTGFRHGRQVPAVPDGSCDITSHVALDACADAGRAAGATSTSLTTQRAALTALGVRGAAPDAAAATTDPTGYLAALRDAGEAAELTARGGLGDFGWLVQGVGMPMPDRIAGL